MVRPRALLVVSLLLGVAGCASWRSTPAWDQPPPPIQTGPIVDASRVHRGELPNGLRLLVLRDDRRPWVRMGVMFPRGEAALSAERAGLATFLAESITRGAGDRGALELASVVDGLGASLGAAAGWDTIAVQVEGLSVDQDTLLDVLVDVVRAPRFESAEVERVRGQILGALATQEDDPRQVVGRGFARSLYGEHRYALPAEGTPESVGGFQIADLESLHAELFRPGGAIFFASGAVDPPALEARLAEVFSDWEGTLTIEPGPAPPRPAPAMDARSVVVIDRPELGQAQIMLGHDGISRTAEDRIPVSLMNRVLGQSGFASRLMARVRSQEGLTYGVYSYFALRRQPGPFAVSTFTRASEVGRVVDLVLEELRAMQQSSLAPDELQRVKSLAAGAFAVSLETSDAVLDSLVDLEIHGLPNDSLDTFRERVSEVTREAALDAAQTRLHPDRAAIVVVGPAEVIRPQLEHLGTVEVVPGREP